jgi:hypothetical protein
MTYSNECKVQELCSHYLNEYGEVVPMFEKIPNDYTVVLAYKILPEDYTHDNAEEGMTMICLADLVEPAKPNLYEYMEWCKRNEIKTRLVTTTNKRLCLKVSYEAGNHTSERNAKEGSDFKAKLKWEADQ